MNFRRAAIFVAFLLLLTVGIVSAQDQTIVEIAQGDENFSTLVDLVVAADLAGTLSEGEYTVFAPTNDAFAKLPPHVVDYLVNNTDVLTQVLLYHVVEGTVMSTDLSDGMTAASLDMGNELTFTVDDMGVMVDNATVTAADIVASNGVIHVVDTVLVPPIALPEVIPAAVVGDILTAGSSTVGPLSVRIADDFAAEGYPGEITVDIIGSGAGFERFCVDGASDIANASRPIRESEVEACGQLDPARTPIEFRVGTDALAVVVNPTNDFVDSLTVEQLAQVFGGAETWADVDPSFPAEPILRFIPGTDSGTFDYFVEEVFDEDPEPIQGTYGASTVQLSEDDNILLEGVANNPYAIGFFGYAYFAQNEDALKVLSIEGVAPTKPNVDAATYPLARPLFIYSDAGVITEKSQVGEFITYYLNNVNDVIEEVGYFAANEYVLRGARLSILPFTGMGDM